MAYPSEERFRRIAEWSRTTDKGKRRSSLIEKRDRCRRHAKAADLTKRRMDAFYGSGYVRRSASTFDDWTFGADEYRSQRAGTWAWCTTWVLDEMRDERKHRNVVLASSRKGSGKSHLAAAMAYELACAGKWAMVWPINEMFRKVKARFDGGRLSSDALIDAWQRCDVLVVDDMGTHRGTTWEIGDVLWPILDARYRDDRATIVTSNAVPTDEAGWNAMLGGTKQESPGHVERIVSRLRESVRLLPMEGSDWRTNGGE